MRRTSTLIVSAVASTVLLAGLAGCGGSSSSGTAASNPPATEFNPPGDIPDNQVFVDFTIPGSSVHLKVPEGWAKKSTAGATTFTDHYNSVRVEVVPHPQPVTVQSATQNELPMLAQNGTNVTAGDVSKVTRGQSTAVLITYQQDSAPDPTTHKVVQDAVERYEFWHNGQEAILTLTGPTGADNVDPWRIVSDSLRWA